MAHMVRSPSPRPHRGASYACMCVCVRFWEPLRAQTQGSTRHEGSVGTLGLQVGAPTLRRGESQVSQEITAPPHPSCKAFLLEGWCPHAVSVTLRWLARQTVAPLRSPSAPQAEEGSPDWTLKEPDEDAAAPQEPRAVSPLPQRASSSGCTRLGDLTAPRHRSHYSLALSGGAPRASAPSAAQKAIISPAAGSGELLCVSTKHRAWHTVREPTQEGRQGGLKAKWPPEPHPLPTLFYGGRRALAVVSPGRSA